jgi:hypothetical protein
MYFCCVQSGSKNSQVGGSTPNYDSVGAKDAEKNKAATQSEAVETV